jgi:hypothetical protein
MNTSEIDKIKNYKTWSVKKKVDALLKMDAHNYTNLGTDSTKKEKKEVTNISRKIYSVIAQLSPVEGYLLEAHMKEKDMSDAYTE